MRALVFVALSACTTLTAPPTADAPTAAPTADAPAARPATATVCAAGAYRHPSPAFCVNLPAELRGKEPIVNADGVLFQGEHETLSVQWAPRSDEKRIALWKQVEPGPDAVGPFSVLVREKLPLGSFVIIHDATQSRTNDMFKIPSVRGTSVVETDTLAFRCSAAIHLDNGGSGGDLLKHRADFLGTCRSFHAQ